MRTPITYYGGKQRIAPEIVAMLPPHKLYCEPFFGGGAVFFAKPRAGIEVINDHDHSLINFYQCVQNNFDELQHLVKQTLHSEAMHKYAKDIWNERVFATNIERAWAIWVTTNGSYSGSMHGGWKWCNGSSGGHTGTFMKGKRDDFTKALQERLNTVQISCRDALKVIRERDTSETFFYLDPPYPDSEQKHYAGYTMKDLHKLLEILKKLKGKFILSNYWTDLLRRYVSENNWNYKEMEVSVRIANLGKGKKKQEIKTRTEVLVYNYDPEPDLFSSMKM
ncbi:MAG: DNA adenine methylase [Proteiniphilum sp.]